MSEATERVLSILRAHGTHATSFQILEPGYEYWFDPDPTIPAPGAVVAYQRGGRYRVAAGVPLAPPAQVAAVAARFVEHARAAGERVLFFSADEPFVRELGALEGGPPIDVVPVGEQPVWDPARYDTAGPTRRTLRAQLHRARNKGVRVRAVAADELHDAPGPLRAEIESVLDRWLAGRRMGVMRFLVDLEPWHLPEERRYYVAEHDDRAVGFLAAIPIYQLDGWFFEDVIRAPDAPNGTVELLVDAAMRDAAARGDRYVTLGLAPLAGIPRGPGPHRVMRAALGWCYDRLGALYAFDGVRAFKARFRPDGWEAQFLVQSPAPLGIGGFQAVLRAFAGGGLLAFGAETFVRAAGRVPQRAWAAVLLTLAALLVPWTVLLALADGARWFGDASIQWAWVAFDALMVGGLAHLARLVARGSPAAATLALLLAGATATDFVLTTVQALNLHAAVTGLAAAFVLAGMLGPLLATALLLVMAVAMQQRRTGRRGRAGSG